MEVGPCASVRAFVSVRVRLCVCAVLVCVRPCVYVCSGAWFGLGDGGLGGGARSLAGLELDGGVVCRVHQRRAPTVVSLVTIDAMAEENLDRGQVARGKASFREDGRFLVGAARPIWVAASIQPFAQLPCTFSWPDVLRLIATHV